MRRQLTAVIATLVLAASPTFAANGNIGLFFDQDGAQCQATVPCDGSVRLYVYALLQGSSGGGITGAEYKIQVGNNDNPDAGWFFSETFDPTATVVGSGAMSPADPSPRGVNVAWASCQHGDGTKVLMETVDIFNSCSTDETLLKVVKHSSASNQFFQCPLFVMCDDPTFTKICLGSNLSICRNPEPPFPNNSTCSSSGQAYLNPGPNRNCTVAVQNSSWSTVKEMFRN